MKLQSDDVAERKAVLEQFSTVKLVEHLVKHVGELFRAEMVLAQSEVSGKARKLLIAGGLVGVLVAFLALGLATLWVTIIALLWLILPFWAAALIATALAFSCAGIFAIAAKSSIDGLGSLLPQRTLRSLKEDFKWIKR